jgi:UDP-N-acetylmuramoyl-tripeptide--D-alanyl-D-alanine ligase
MLCAAAIGNYFKVSIKDIAKALSGYVPSNNRSQVSKTEHNTLILDAYNANPSSMENAIDAFYLDKSDAKALILGDMFELGEESELEHQKIITKVQQLGFTEVYWVGEMFSQISPSIGKSFKTTADCFAYLKDNPIRKKKILIKGSRGIALEKLVELL